MRLATLPTHASWLVVVVLPLHHGPMGRGSRGQRLAGRAADPWRGGAISSVSSPYPFLSSPSRRRRPLLLAACLSWRDLRSSSRAAPNQLNIGRAEVADLRWPTSIAGLSQRWHRRPHIRRSSLKTYTLGATQHAGIKVGAVDPRTPLLWTLHPLPLPLLLYIPRYIWMLESVTMLLDLRWELRTEERVLKELEYTRETHYI